MPLSHSTHLIMFVALNEHSTFFYFYHTQGGLRNNKYTKLPHLKWWLHFWLFFFHRQWLCCSVKKKKSICWAYFPHHVPLNVHKDAHSHRVSPGSLSLSLHHNICLIKSHQSYFPHDGAVCHCSFSWLLCKCPKTTLCLLSCCNVINLIHEKTPEKSFQKCTLDCFTY